MALEGRISTPDGVLFRVIAGEAVVLNLNSESYFGLECMAFLASCLFALLFAPRAALRHFLLVMPG